MNLKNPQKIIKFIMTIVLFQTSYSQDNPRILVEQKQVIWGLDLLAGGDLVYGLKSGEIYKYHKKTKKSELLYRQEVVKRGQGGLLDIRFHQGDLYYCASVGALKGAVVALFKTKLAKTIKPKVIFKARTKGNTGRHFGCRIEFDKQSLFLSLGDRGRRQYVQNTTNHNGKVLRLDLEGKAFSQNIAVRKPEWANEIYSYGHRNPQGLAFHPWTGELWLSEFGPKGGDEVNIINEGLNYGWPLATYGREYSGEKIAGPHKEGTVGPFHYWDPSISPSGIAFYKKGKRVFLLLAGLSSRKITVLELKENKVVVEKTLFSDLGERFRTLRVDGPRLFFSTDSGRIYSVDDLGKL